METKLLTQYRKEAKENIYLVPFKSNKDEVFIHYPGMIPFYWGLHVTDTTGEDWWNVREITYPDYSHDPWDGSNKLRPFQFEDAVKMLPEMRRVWVLQCIHDKQERKRRKKRIALAKKIAKELKEEI